VRRGSSALKLLQLFKKRNGSYGKGHPVDRYISTYPTNAYTVDPDTSVITYMAGWGWGNDIAAMLVNIRAESPYTLTGGANLYQPTLQVYGHTTIDIVPTGNVGISFELVTCTPQRGRTGSATLAATATAFAGAWAQSYDARSTGFEFFPDTSILENTTFFDSLNNPWVPTGRITGTVRVGSPKRYILKYKTRAFRYAEYSVGTFLTEGQAGGKSYLHIIKVRGERGQVCGTKGANNQPILTEMGSPVMVKVRCTYYYRWVPGNNRPTIYGSNLGPSEGVNEDARQWVGVPALKAQRAAQATDVIDVNFTNWGGQDLRSKHESLINPIWDCTGGVFIPQVTGL